MAYSVPKLKDFSAKALDKAAEKLLDALATESKAVRNADDLKAFRDHWMARKDGVLTQINDLWLKAAPKEAKREGGQRVNGIKEQVEQKITDVGALLSAPLQRVMHLGIDVPASELEAYE